MNPGRRPHLRVLLAIPILLLFAGFRQRAVEQPAGWPLTDPPRDVFSFSRPEQVVTRHVRLDLHVDFPSRTLRGTATLEIENLSGAGQLILDTDQLSIEGVTLDGTSSNATWSLGATTPYGRPLTIGIEPDTTSVTVSYVTSPGASGLLWNTAEQSYGRRQPYLYSLSEPVGARSWIPIQDTPTVRMTYEATLHVPRGLVALMSASNNPREANDTGVYVFDMPFRVPAYLFAIAAGRLEFHPFDDRTGVYAEPELIEDAAWELQYIPEMVQVAESLAGPYPFHRYDVLLMPPTFVAGGMEHPMLNFINPFSVVTGNRPAVPEPTNLIAHELAHSWSGDSSTLATWNDVWINEGITSYLALRILEEMSGIERAELGWFNDRRGYAAASAELDPWTILHRQVEHPGDGFDQTGYTKGSLFIRTLEDHIGRAAFDAFLKNYFRTFAFRWVDDQQFVTLLRELELDARPGLEEQIRLDEWLYAPGLPSNVTAPSSSVMYRRMQDRAFAFSTGTSITALESSVWSESEITLFLQLADPGVLRMRMGEVDATLALSSRVTPPHTWLLRAIAAGYEPAMPAVERILMRGGTNGAVVQLYAALVAAPGGRQRALQIFSQARDRYHDGVEAQVAGILGLSALQRNAA